MCPFPNPFPPDERRYFYIVEDTHNQLVEQAYAARGFDTEEQKCLPRRPCHPPRHPYPQCIKSPASGRSLWLKKKEDAPLRHHPVRIPGRFSASEVWNSNKKLSRAVAYRAIDRCIELADQHGIGQVVDQAFHYLWGGGYVMEGQAWLPCLHQLHRLRY